MAMSNAERQAKWRARKKAKGLVVSTIFVATATRPEIRELGHAFDIDPTLVFSPHVGCLRRANGQFTSPRKIANK